jgi:hypothetical protein
MAQAGEKSKSTKVLQGPFFGFPQNIFGGLTLKIFQPAT